MAPDNELYAWVNENIWLDGRDLAMEYKQAKEEGHDLSSVEDEFARLLAVPKPDDSGQQHIGGQRDEQWWRDALVLVDRVEHLPFRPDYAYVEPSDLAGIQKTRPKAPPLKAYKKSHAAYVEQLHGGLLGRICGCMLGKPVECWMRKKIRAVADGTGNWPLSYYLRWPSAREQKKIMASGIVGSLPGIPNTNVLHPTINGMVEDDDVNYTVAGFAVVKKHGKNFTPLQVAQFWCNNIPIFHTCTAERAAYRNFVEFILPPKSAVRRNPFRELIGAQIRADYFGYANPGNPVRAAEWAWRDACISHVKNGIYGEMWVAGMLAAAFVERDAKVVILHGLAQVPKKCRLAEAVLKIVDAHQRGETYEAVVEQIHQQWNECVFYDWCHTISNAQVVATALLFGEDDYEKTISRAVMPGFDTDCNGATAGSVWGVMHGAKAIPRKWTKAIKNIVRTGVAGYHETTIDGLAEEMADVARKQR